MEITKITLVIMFTCWAAVTDVSRREIDNWLLGIFLITGVVLNVISGNFVGALISFTVSTLIVLFVYWINESFMGEGDLKYLIALSTFMGLSWAFGAFFYSLFVFLIVAAIYMIKDKTRKPCVPYAVPFLGGVIWQHISPLI